jgi:hypothetical protein
MISNKLFFASFFCAIVALNAEDQKTDLINNAEQQKSKEEIVQQAAEKKELEAVALALKKAKSKRDVLKENKRLEFIELTRAHRGLEADIDAAVKEGESMNEIKELTFYKDYQKAVIENYSKECWNPKIIVTISAAAGAAVVGIIWGIKEFIKIGLRK